jgi:hypothetical protein
VRADVSLKAELQPPSHGAGGVRNGERQVAPAVPQLPGPSIGRLAASCECSRQAIGPNWMSAPV